MTQVEVISEDGLRHRVLAGNHVLVADEPAHLGGQGSGVTPYELLLAALGTCTSMTLLMYARRREWPLEGVRVRLSHERVHARDCADCPQTDAWLEVINKEIEVRGPLSADQLTRLAEIAERCPVNRTLHQSVHTRQRLSLAG